MNRNKKKSNKKLNKRAIKNRDISRSRKRNSLESDSDDFSFITERPKHLLIGQVI